MLRSGDEDVDRSGEGDKRDKNSERSGKIEMIDESISNVFGILGCLGESLGREELVSW